MSPKQIKMAKAVCSSCPVFEECLTQALSEGEQYGVWAGTSGRERKRIHAMIVTGEVTLDEVVEDYINGQTTRYESGVRASFEGIRDEAAG